VALAAAGLVIPSSAFAQSSPTRPAWFVGGLGGVTFTAVTGGAVAGQVGRRIGPNLFFIGEVGRMQNVMPKEIDDLIDDLIDQVDAGIAANISLNISAPATYGFFGGRWVPLGTSLSPFVEGGIGAAKVSLKVGRVALFGVDLRDQVLEAIGARTSVTDFLTTIGFGVTGRLGGATAFDAGYRYTHVATARPDVTSSMLYAAVKFVR
jgi:hypothetical protein